jgi:transcriptional regulator with XRE-family HTH domain
MSNYIKENLSHLVSRLIREKKLSLREVEERVAKAGGKIEKSYISRIMSGNVKNITLEKLVALARGLDEDPNTLFKAYCNQPVSSGSKLQEVLELRAVDFAALMHKVASNPTLVEIMEEVVRLPHGEEPEAMLRYVRFLNESIQKAKSGKEKMPRKETRG